MSDFTKLAGIIQTIFNDEADKIATESGFIKREEVFRFNICKDACIRMDSKF